MDFEPLDEELEEFLQGIIEKSDECSGTAQDIEFYSPEYRDLKDLEYFEVVSEYLDGTALIRPKRKAFKYFDRKKEWEKQRKVDAAKGVGEKVVDKTTDMLATIATKMITGQ